MNNFSERLRKCFNENFWEIDKTEGSHFGVFNWEGDCIYEGSSLQDCIDYCNKNNRGYRMSNLLSEPKDEIEHFSEINVKPYCIKSIGYHPFRNPHYDGFEVYEISTKKSVYKSNNKLDCEKYCKDHNLDYDYCLAK